jgi:hypothetical protein
MKVQKRACLCLAIHPQNPNLKLTVKLDKKKVITKKINLTVSS